MQRYQNVTAFLRNIVEIVFDLLEELSISWLDAVFSFADAIPGWFTLFKNFFGSLAFVSSFDSNCVLKDVTFLLLKYPNAVEIVLGSGYKIGPCNFQATKEILFHKMVDK